MYHLNIQNQNGGVKNIELSKSKLNSLKKKSHSEKKVFYNDVVSEIKRVVSDDSLYKTDKSIVDGIDIIKSNLDKILTKYTNGCSGEHDSENSVNPLTDRINYEEASDVNSTTSQSVESIANNIKDVTESSTSSKNSSIFRKSSEVQNGGGLSTEYDNTFINSIVGGDVLPPSNKNKNIFVSQTNKFSENPNSLNTVDYLSETSSFVPNLSNASENNNLSSIKFSATSANTESVQYKKPNKFTSKLNNVSENISDALPNNIADSLADSIVATESKYVLTDTPNY